MPSTYKPPEFPYSTPLEVVRAKSRARRWRRRRRAGRAGGGDRPGAARHPVRLLDDNNTVSTGLARHLLRQAHAGDPRPPRLRRARCVRAASAGTSAGLLPRPRGLRASTCCRRPATPSGVRQPAAVPPRGGAGGARSGRWVATNCAGRTGSVGVEPDGRRRAAHVETPDGKYTIAPTGWSSPTARAARSARCSGWTSRAGLPRPLPDRRRGDEGRLSGRALVLVRPAVPPNQSVLLHRRPTTSGASTSSSAGTPTPRKRRSPSA
jgi:hypothetical protein